MDLFASVPVAAAPQAAYSDEEEARRYQGYGGSGGDDDLMVPAFLRRQEREDLAGIARNLDWDLAPDRLQAGDLTGLRATVQQAIRNAAARPAVVALAGKLGVQPIVLVIALMAQAVAPQNRSARRLARALLPATPSEDQKTVARALGV